MFGYVCLSEFVCVAGCVRAFRRAYVCYRETRCLVLFVIGLSLTGSGEGNIKKSEA